MFRAVAISSFSWSDTNSEKRAWTNFAKYCDPTPPDMWNGYEWTPRLVENTPHYFNISGQDSAMATSAEIQERMALWDLVLEKN